MDTIKETTIRINIGADAGVFKGNGPSTIAISIKK